MKHLRYLLLPIVAALALAGLPTTTAVAHATAVTDGGPNAGITTFGLNVTTCPASNPCTFQTLHSDDPNAIHASYSTGGSPSSYGSRWVEVWVTDHDILGQVIYRYHVRLAWSWGYGTVYNPAGSSWVTNIDQTHQWTGNWGTNYWYNYAWGLWNSGYRFYREGQITNCVLTICGFTTHPYGWVRGHGDGTYSFDWGYA